MRHKETIYKYTALIMADKLFKDPPTTLPANVVAIWDILVVIWWNRVVLENHLKQQYLGLSSFMECAGKQVVTGLLRGTQQIICINTWKTYFELKPSLNVKTWRLLLDNLSSHHEKPCIIEGEGGNLCPVPVLISKIPTSWCTACEQKCSWSQIKWGLKIFCM